MSCLVALEALLVRRVVKVDLTEAVVVKLFCLPLVLVLRFLSLTTNLDTVSDYDMTYAPTVIGLRLVVVLVVWT